MDAKAMLPFFQWTRNRIKEVTRCAWWQSAAVHARLQEVEDDAAVTALGTLLASMRQSYRRSTVEATCHIFDSHGQIMVLA